MLKVTSQDTEPALVGVALSRVMDTTVASGRVMVMAKVSGAEIEILHVIELAEEFPFGTTYFDADYGVLYAGVDRELSRRADRVRAAGLRCETKIIEGSAAGD